MFEHVSRHSVHIWKGMHGIPGVPAVNIETVRKDEHAKSVHDMHKTSKLTVESTPINTLLSKYRLPALFGSFVFLKILGNSPGK